MAIITPGTGTRVPSRKVRSRGGPLGPARGGRVITPKTGPTKIPRHRPAKPGGPVTPRGTVQPAMTTGGRRPARAARPLPGTTSVPGEEVMP